MCSCVAHAGQPSSTCVLLRYPCITAVLQMLVELKRVFKSKAAVAELQLNVTLGWALLPFWAIHTRGSGQAPTQAGVGNSPSCIGCCLAWRGRTWDDVVKADFRERDRDIARHCLVGFVILLINSLTV